jgi:hypothetical protein
MSGLVFESAPPIVASAPNRSDIACFIGFVSRRNTPLPSPLAEWLKEQGWTDGSGTLIKDLLDLPVPIDAWNQFDQLFAWEQRALDQNNQIGSTYLGAAVRSFFAQGGRKCYVIRVGDPWRLTTPQSERLAQIKKLIPGYPAGFAGSAVDRTTWHGVGHLFGLPDVSYLCLPDLADAVAMDRQRLDPPNLPPSPLEQFVECSAPVPQMLDRAARLFQAPRCDVDSYNAWTTALWLVADLLIRQQREVQLIASVPLPETDLDLLTFFTKPTPGFVPPLAIAVQEQKKGLASAFVQLAYPWVQTPGSTNLPEQLESPDAVLAGVLARNALTRGSFRSAANLHLADVQQVYPILTRDLLQQSQPDSATRSTRHTLPERISLLGSTPSGLRLLSDVTTSLDESYRPASVNRLVAAIVRAARRLGEEVVFEASCERLWMRLRDSLTTLMSGLQQAGALQDAGTTAFAVRCDRDTMTQQDIDQGRVIAHIEFVGAAPIDQITIVLALNTGGQVSLIPSQEAA